MTSGWRAPAVGAFVAAVAAALLVAGVPPARSARTAAGSASGPVRSGPAGAVGAGPEAPQRVVSLVPGGTQTLLALGAGSLLVGASRYDELPAALADVARVGALLDADLEGILALRPDLVIVDPAQASLAARLHAAGIATYAYNTGTLADVRRHILQLGDRLGRAPVAQRTAAAWDARLQRLRARFTHPRAPAVLLVFGRRRGGFGELWVCGGVGFLHELLEAAGGRNVWRAVARPSFKAGLEATLRRVPDVVVELRLQEEAVRPAQLTAEWRSLPGYAHVAVVVVGERWVGVPGPRVLDAIELLGERMAEALSAPGR